MDNATLEVYKCPSCGGAVRYDATASALSCAWCHNAYDSADLETKQVNAELEGYLCPECGAQLLADDFIVADTCPYCGNNEVAPHRFEGAYEPDLIIPFSISKQQAVEYYKHAIAEKRYLPDDFVAEHRILSVQGAYVPFWLKDGVIDFDCTYKSLKRSSKGELNPHFYHRVGAYEYTRTPADGSQRMPDDMMDSLEPYDFDELVPFSNEYLPGFVAERYTITSEEVEDRIGLRMGVSAILAAKQTVPVLSQGPYIVEDRCTTLYRNTREEQALLPAWLIVVEYHGEKYLAGVNGQTGKVAVNLPIDEEKQAKYALKNWLVSELSWLWIFIAIMLAIVIAMIVCAPGGIELYAAIAVIIITLLAICVPNVKRSFEKSKAKVQADMQNVKEAKDVGAYDLSCMTLTLSETGQGPLVDRAK